MMNNNKIEHQIDDEKYTIIILSRDILILLIGRKNIN